MQHKNEIYFSIITTRIIDKNIGIAVCRINEQNFKIITGKVANESEKQR